MSIQSSVIDNHRMKTIRNEFTRLGDKCYLENAGSALYPQRLLKKVNEDLLNNVYLNPHTDKETKDCIEQVRNIVLSHFNTNALSYSLIFTSGTTQSLKLVLESFQFYSNNTEDSGSFVYLLDSHTSVIGLRELAKEKNANIINISHEEFLSSLRYFNGSENCQKKGHDNNTLLAYPAQSNFNGFKYPIDCIEDIKNGCLNNFIRKKLCAVNCDWYVLLDAASFVATSNIDLSCTQPDFVCLSFYKVFGFPSGLGALLVKNKSANVLSQKIYFGGGTVDIVLSNENFHVKRNTLHERFEDGTVPFLSIIALRHCFDTLHSLIPKTVNNNMMDTISYHVFYLAKDLHKQLSHLQHKNGRNAVILYMDSNFTDINIQGGIIAFNLVRENGSYIGYAEFQHMAELFNINIRTGCFCNSGSCQRHLNISNSEVKNMYQAGHKCGDEVDLVNGKPTGAIRVSFGYYNTFDDVDKLMLMITKCFVRKQFQQPTRQMINMRENKKAIGVTVINKITTFISDRLVSPAIIETQSSPTKMTLSEISIFPIKSCGAFKIKSGWRIGSKGFEHDRGWMIIKDNGVCLTQKQSTHMCKIKPYVDIENQCLTLYFKGYSPISIPLNFTLNNNFQETQVCQSKVCTDFVKGNDCGDEVADWISNCLEISYLRLIRQSSDRIVKSDGKQKLLSLSNQAQYLLVNKATVRWLKGKIKDETFSDNIDSMVDRFRGNLVIESPQELIEKQWQKLVIGTHEFKVEGQCSRCQMVCIDQMTGEKTIEPLRTISEEFGGKMRFGIYLSYVGPINNNSDKILNLKSEVIPFP